MVTWASAAASSADLARWAVGRRERQRASALDPERADRVAWQHVVGEFDLDWASDVDEGGPVDRASNRVRRADRTGRGRAAAGDGALFRGLVVGDDRDQPRAMIDRFRASGLSHLTAVSGQNVAFVLAATGPLLRRLRRWPRLVVTVGLIAWFVALTRFEPSILRAGAMAVLSAVAYATGRERAPLRILSVAVIGPDPDRSADRALDRLLVVGGCNRRCRSRSDRGWRTGFAGSGSWRCPSASRSEPSSAWSCRACSVFGRLPLVSVPANLLAVPVAGAVMLYGLPAGLLAGWVPAIGAGRSMLPGAVRDTMGRHHCDAGRTARARAAVAVDRLGAIGGDLRRRCRSWCSTR